MTKNMKNFNSQKLIILSLVVFFVLTSFWLSFISARYLNPDYNSDWWAISFENPKNQSLNFTIENHSSKNNFHWEAISNDTIKQEDNIQLAKGEIKNIPIIFSTEVGRKITIKVSTDNEVKEIYKNF